MSLSRGKNRHNPRRKQSLKGAAKSARRQRPKPPTAVAKLFAGNQVGKLFEELVGVQARLRAPGGCPWDREQTHLTLRTYLIEEAYEVLDAIESANAPELAEELGDLLLQVLFHADLAREAGAFDITDVIRNIRDKMIRRHPHVFGNVKAETAGEVLKNWAKLKADEKQSARRTRGASEQGTRSALEGVARHLPALVEAFQLTRKAAQVGFDWENIEDVVEKLNEELAELRESLENREGRATEEEVGDLLFTLVNVARFLKLDPEVVLKKANLKFKTRFEDMERSASRSGALLSELSKEELEVLWQSEKSKSAAEALWPSE